MAMRTAKLDMYDYELLIDGTGTVKKVFITVHGALDATISDVVSDINGANKNITVEGYRLIMKTAYLQDGDFIKNEPKLVLDVVDITPKVIKKEQYNG